MRRLGVDEILALWERLRNASSPARALAFAARARDATPDVTGELSVGDRDCAIIGLRRATFGDVAPCFVRCPACTADLELEVDLAALEGGAPERPGELVIERDDFVVRFRLPRALDMIALAAIADHHDAVAALLDACVLRAERAGDTIGARRLPDDIRDAIAERIAELDPMAEITFALTCHECGHGWSAPFDICTYLWREIDVEARRLLTEVDALARVYGWSEAEILALSTTRRRAYLEL
ncbi:MAG TPA: hypothetical protein VG755_27300, partial [Nannocystaceae bacterium]|nr:hypothetical protein [Nannocystaceae bacterium]